MEPGLAGTEVNSVVLYGMLSLITVLIGIVGFFLGKVYDKLEKLDNLNLRFGILESKFDEKFEDIAIVKRDQQGLWRNIDFLKTKMGISVDATRTTN